jgi:hypothetical protein
MLEILIPKPFFAKDRSPQLADADDCRIESVEGEFRADFDEHLAEAADPASAPSRNALPSDAWQQLEPHRPIVGKRFDEQGIHVSRASLDVALLS